MGRRLLPSGAVQTKFRHLLTGVVKQNTFDTNFLVRDTWIELVSANHGKQSCTEYAGTSLTILQLMLFRCV